MELTNINTIKQLCKKYGLQPNRSNGQNFLIDKNVLEKIVAAGELKKDDLILEIGPGFGVLTQELVKHAGKVVAVEKDKRLAEYLVNSHKQPPQVRGKQLTATEAGQAINNNLEVVNNDILKIDPLFYLPLSKGESKRNYKIISNLPYQITAPVLWKFLQEDDLTPTLSLVRRGGLEMLVLMVQKEVGERICAKPGKMSVLSVLCQFYAECEIISQVSKNCFWPVPEVDSVILKMTPRTDADWTRNYAELTPHVAGQARADAEINEKEFMRMVKIGFSAKRKMLKNNLAAGLVVDEEKIRKILNQIKINEKIRAQELSIEEWKSLYEKLHNNGII